MTEFHKNHLDKEQKIIIKVMEDIAASPKSRPEFKNQLFQKISQKYYPEKKAGFWHTIPNFFRYSAKFPALVASTLIVVIAFGVTGTYAYVSPEVNREHSLYGIKKAIENFQYNLSFSEESKVQKHLDFAQRREAEFENVYLKKAELDDQTIKEMLSNIQQAYKITATISDKQDRQNVTREVKETSTEIVNDIKEIISDVENERVKVKVKKKPEIEEIKREIKNIEKQSQNASQNSFNQPPTSENPVVSEPTPVCQEECDLNDRRCTVDENQGFTGGYQICGNFDDDSCAEWGEAALCPENTMCSDNGVCVELPTSCQDECIPGSKEETPEGTKICANTDQDSCTEWEYDTKSGNSNSQAASEPSTSPGSSTGQPSSEPSSSQNSSSSQPAGTSEPVSSSEPITPVKSPVYPKYYPPKPSCNNECENLEQRQCSGNGYQICGNYDTDECLEWGEINSCPAESSCQEGACLATKKEPACENECQSEGERICDNGGYRICGNYDEDTCLEWGDTNSCPVETSCQDGVCL